MRYTPFASVVTRAQQPVVAIQLDSPAFEHALVRFQRAVEVRVVPRLAVQDALARDGADVDR